jgi:hypothetical protein
MRYRCPVCLKGVRTRVSKVDHELHPIAHKNREGVQCTGWLDKALPVQEHVGDPIFDQVATEYADGTQSGADFGSRVRVIMRSDTHVMFVGLGVNLAPRNTGYHALKKIAGKASRELLSRPETRAQIVEAFGPGADEAAILAATTRGKGTVLVNGGGESLMLPATEHREIVGNHYESISPTTGDLISPDRRCVQCGTPLRPNTIHHNLDSDPTIDPNHPRTLEDCQRLTNYPIFRVHGYEQRQPENWWPYVSWFEAWDGESYIDDTFCNDKCAARYGRRAAAELARLEAGGEPPAPARHPHEHVKHYDPDEQARRHRASIEEHFARVRSRQHPSA